MSMIPIKKKDEKRTYVLFWLDEKRLRQVVQSVSVDCPPLFTEHEAHKVVIKTSMQNEYHRPPIGDIRIIRVDDMVHYEIDLEMTIKEIMP